jgi:hypothetical protein
MRTFSRRLDEAWVAGGLREVVVELAA